MSKMRQLSSSFRISHANKSGALFAIHQLRGTHAVNNVRPLTRMLVTWDWIPKTDDCDDIVGLRFDGDEISDDLLLFTAIAPYVDAGSFIEMVGEDGAKWRWCFDGKTCEEVYYAETVWPE